MPQHMRANNCAPTCKISFKKGQKFLKRKRAHKTSAQMLGCKCRGAIISAQMSEHKSRVRKCRCAYVRAQVREKL
jgi:hypothetical protein